MAKTVFSALIRWLNMVIAPGNLGRLGFLGLGRTATTSDKGGNPSLLAWMWFDGTLDVTGSVQNYRSMSVSMWNRGRCWPGGVVVNSEVM